MTEKTKIYSFAIVFAYKNVEQILSFWDENFNQEIN